jgi:hypothetical protein
MSLDKSSIGEASVRSFSAYLLMEANPVAGVISGHISTVVPITGVMGAVMKSSTRALLFW